jgi:hypothetical protein
VIVIAFVNNDGDFGRFFGALGGEITHDNYWIIPYDTRNEIWARLGIPVRKPSISGCFSWLMERHITVLFFTPSHLPLIKHVHRIRETVVRVLEFLGQVPPVRLIRWFGSGQW